MSICLEKLLLRTNFEPLDRSRMILEKSEKYWKMIQEWLGSHLGDWFLVDSQVLLQFGSNNLFREKGFEQTRHLRQVSNHPRQAEVLE